MTTKYVITLIEVLVLVLVLFFSVTTILHIIQQTSVD